LTPETDVGARVIIALRNGLTQIVEELNEVLAEMAPPEATSATGIPKIDLGELEAAGWTSYATKEAAKEGEAGWIKNPAHFTTFEAPQVIYELVKALNKAKGHRLQLGVMTYFFSGEKKFISRQPAKQEKAR